MLDRTTKTILDRIDDHDLSGRLKMVLADAMADSIVKELDVRESHIREMRRINDEMYHHWEEERRAKQALEAEVERLKAEVIRLSDALTEMSVGVLLRK